MDVAVAKEGGFTILQLMEQAGFCCSIGSACRSELRLCDFQGVCPGEL